MTIWIFALILTAIACATLFYAGAGRTVNAGVSVADATAAHFRAQLAAIDEDAAVGRLGPAEATAAKGELAREVLRLKDEAAASPAPGGKAIVLGSVVLVAALSLGTYYFLGKPELPAEPLAGRTGEASAPATATTDSGSQIDLDAAIKTIEQRLAEQPDDLRGWQVIAPAYMQLGRYADAVKALRRVNELQAPTADSLTDLGEAVMMANGGAVAGEPLELFRKAAALDAQHVRSRFYVASEETRAGQFEPAIRDWNELLVLAKGDEPWVVTARNGLAFAQAGLNPEATQPSQPDAAQIATMVDGLEARLKSSGGSIDEWTRLVRSRIVQGRASDAQAAYDLAAKAYPDASVRGEIDALAKDNGLVTK